MSFQIYNLEIKLIELNSCAAYLLLLVDDFERTARYDYNIDLFGDTLGLYLKTDSLLKDIKSCTTSNDLNEILKGYYNATDKFKNYFNYQRLRYLSTLRNGD